MGMLMRATVISAEPATINYGMFIQNILDFLIIAMCIFLMVRFITKLTHSKKEEEKPAAPAPKPDDVVLLEEIRDLLKKQNQEKTK